MVNAIAGPNPGKALGACQSVRREEEIELIDAAIP
jgi:hypothetical protein